MADFAKMLREHAASDHKRGCHGRCYSCECGHDLATDQRLLEAADHVEALLAELILARARIEYLGAACNDPRHFNHNADVVLPRVDAVISRVVGQAGERS